MIQFLSYYQYISRLHLTLDEVPWVPESTVQALYFSNLEEFHH
jgi:hypothetical protein